MKRVLFVFDTVTHYHQELLRELETALALAEVELFLLSGSPVPGASGRVAVAGKTLTNELKYSVRELSVGTYTFRWPAIQSAVNRVAPDAIVCMAHVGDAAHWQLALNKRRRGYRLLAWQCGYEYHPSWYKNWLLSKFVPRFDHHMAYHSNAKHYAIEHGASAGDVTVMHNTINESNIKILDKETARMMVVERHPSVGTRKIVLFVGAVLAEKKIGLIIDAMKLIDTAQAVLIVVGDGPDLPRLKSETTESDNVIFAGKEIARVGMYFDAAEVYVLPGTGGLGINEAMAHSLPVICGEADGSADDLVIDGVNGLRLSELTASELATKINFVLSDPVRARNMGEVSRKWITSKFSFMALIGRMRDTIAAAVRA
jgi:glycosyltransferase involved in cell wall biosynthesis